MEICVLASGSKGNATCVTTKESCLLFDIGISLRTLKKNLSNIGKSPDEIDAVFISHEHTDHIRGISSFAKNYDTKICLTPGTYASMPYISSAKLFEQKKDLIINDLTVTAIKTSHDAANPSGFSIVSKDKKCVVFTDLGFASQEIQQEFSGANCAVLEANHDVDTLLNGNYPYHLKQRILGDKGHLSNIDAGLLVRDHASSKLKNVFLAHLSENNNTPQLALNTFESLSRQNKELRHKTILTNQYAHSEIVNI